MIDDTAMGEVDDDDVLAFLAFDAADETIVPHSQLPVAFQFAGVGDKTLPRVVQFFQFAKDIPNSFLIGRPDTAKVFEGVGMPFNPQDPSASTPPHSGSG